ncbi:hypothetical protein HETIRDRAFT_430629 [Heterobasidion irregulare TC 32-1]|uniref:Uncharacterized protein n=1 Tax=Heterobasidion irregulare (strain TC 32-1) TaxID=747525 RepID=W4JNT3_HETIT|nr:uncharacterized protein HETIRDRAFT_430629 [Heterobasidion irregulare TC 32-1]ETW75144.1 hypothetical protein HETIRDRAFT_430629 [Heterobasidion irregulare TC 32-1]
MSWHPPLLASRPARETCVDAAHATHLGAKRRLGHEHVAHTIGWPLCRHSLELGCGLALCLRCVDNSHGRASLGCWFSASGTVTSPLRTDPSTGLSGCWVLGCCISSDMCVGVFSKAILGLGINSYRRRRISMPRGGPYVGDRRADACLYSSLQGRPVQAPGAQHEHGMFVVGLLSSPHRSFHPVTSRQASLLDSCRGSQKNHVDFCRAITEPPFIAKKLLEHVRCLNFHDWMPRSEESAWVNQAILKKYATVIGDFIRVQSLQLDRVTISKAFFREVVNMFGLRDVVIVNCTFEAYGLEKDALFRKKHIVPWTSIVFDTQPPTQRPPKPVPNSVPLVLPRRIRDWPSRQTLKDYLMHDNELVHHTDVSAKRALFALHYLIQSRPRATPDPQLLCRGVSKRYDHLAPHANQVAQDRSLMDAYCRTAQVREAEPMRDYAGCFEGLFEKVEITLDLRILLGLSIVLEDGLEEHINIV